MLTYATVPDKAVRRLVQVMVFSSHWQMDNTSAQAALAVQMNEFCQWLATTDPTAELVNLQISLMSGHLWIALDADSPALPGIQERIAAQIAPPAEK